MQLTTDIDLVISTLKSGGVVVYPTETTYGIGCDATNVAAVDRIFAIKGRPQAKGVTALLPKNEWGDRIGLVWPPALRELAEKHWPGALNVVLPAAAPSEIVPAYLTNGTLAVRRSSHPVANALVDALGVPLVSTSANISGEPELYSAKEIFDRFSGEAIQPDVIFDAGELPKRAPSTLIVWDDARGVVVLRQGEIQVF
ncbi:MAG: L-threonylcarbamoyladenylate synthase [Patescibacteria group bacterium]